VREIPGWSNWVQQTFEKVREIRRNILAAQSRKKSYADVRRPDLEFAVGDQVLLRVSPTKGVVRCLWKTQPKIHWTIHYLGPSGQPGLSFATAGFHGRGTPGISCLYVEEVFAGSGPSD
jgi:hypothetical protein